MCTYLFLMCVCIILAKYICSAKKAAVYCSSILANIWTSWKELLLFNTQPTLLNVSLIILLNFLEGDFFFFNFKYI